MTVRLVLLAVMAWWAIPAGPAAAETPSRCIAFVENGPRIVPAALPGTVSVPEVEITYVTHSTFSLRTPAGIVIATDYAGYFGGGPAPHIATMNHAHETHYTDYPDPAIKHVLRGWNPLGSGPAEHHLVVEDVLVRNVATDIRSWGGLVESDGNSIFIFETADLCIGHLGHLHHKPTRDQFARIGRLDIVFAAVDGGLTLDHPTLIETLNELQASLVIPMHYFGRGSLEAFLIGMSSDFEIKVNDSATTRVSLPALPRRPTVLVLPGY
ncbi:MAG: MBL fold metallo-hydrolase [Rhodospirillales bacterium]|nr:MAG: MBL fold metallo-hydrolase [Rhodospirillales bacterium]